MERTIHYLLFPRLFLCFFGLVSFLPLLTIHTHTHTYIYIYITGRTSRILEKGTSALLTVELDEEVGRSAKEVRGREEKKRNKETKKQRNKETKKQRNKESTQSPYAHILIIIPTTFKLL